MRNNIYNMMICIISIDARSDAHSKAMMYFYWTNIVEGGPSLKQLACLLRSESVAGLIYVYTAQCVKEQHTLKRLKTHRWLIKRDLKS